MYEELVKNTAANLNKVYRHGLQAAEEVKHNAAIQEATKPKDNLWWEFPFFVDYEFNEGCRDDVAPCGDQDPEIVIHDVFFRGIRVTHKLTKGEISDIGDYILENHPLKGV